MSLLYRRVVLSRGIVLFTLFFFSLNVTVSAAIITTQQIVSSDKSLHLSSLDSELNRYRLKLKNQLVAFGVTPEQVSTRLNAMTDSEIAALSSKISELPAGGDVLSIIALVFLVLLFTDIAGYTDLFPFVKKTAGGSKNSTKNGGKTDRRPTKTRSEPIVIEN